ncbi:MAG: MoxR family ATPase [Candidatus Riflebacteria bacterium]|nr:MoxR family ATPase [Candidatus Riflebacteria bacterium]
MEHTNVERLQKMLALLNRVILGKEEVVELVLVTLLSGGHLLLEDQPGVGKTTLGTALAHVVRGSFSRVQFTADLLPADIVGSRIYRRRDEAFEFVQGPIFANFILADELNRAPPKTQSALLQAMNEGCVTVDRETISLPAPFMVIATQNPRGSQGTYPLPESQRDRFLMRLSIGYPDAITEMKILRERRISDPLKDIEPILDAGMLLAIREDIHKVILPEPVIAYMVRLSETVRRHEDVNIAVSPRGTLALMRSSQALACLRGRDLVDFDMVKHLAPFVLGHRLGLRTLDPWLTGEGASPQWIRRELLERVSIE